jgi:hypothetical protein
VKGNTETLTAVLETALDANGELKHLQYPFNITVSKSQSLLLYEINYIQTVNADPNEQTISTNVFTCDDGGQSPEPTCGWYVDAFGAVVPQSQVGIFVISQHEILYL